MKKLTTVFIAILFVLSTTGLCFAQAQAPAPSQVSPDRDAMSAKPLTKEELQKRKDLQAEKKKAKKAKKAEGKMTREQKKAKMKEEWKKEREAPKPPVESGVPK